MKRSLIPIILLLIIILLSILAPYIAPHSPNEINMKERLASPTYQHVLGTDSLGRDVFSRLLYGGRQSLVLAFLAVVLSMGIGLVMGFLSGYFGGRIDQVITILSNILMGLPGMSIKIALLGLLGPSMRSLILAIIVNAWVSFSRMVRGEVMRVKNEYYIEAAKNIGVRDVHIFICYILPNVSDSLIVMFFSKIGNTLLGVAALSYIGLGLRPPTPDWAIMIAEARQYFRVHPLLVIAPGICITMFVWSVLSIGDWLRDRLDIRGQDSAFL